MGIQSRYKPGDIVDGLPHLIGDELSFEKLREMQGELVILSEECLPGVDASHTTEMQVMMVLAVRTDSFREYIVLEDEDGEDCPYRLYPDEMIPAKNIRAEYTRVWKLIQPDDDEQEDHMIDITTKLPPAPAEATTPEYLAAFNLNARIHYCKDSVERGLAEMCVGIEQMHFEKQYKVLGYQNFEDYCKQEFGFSREQGRKYSDVGKMLKDENANSSWHFEELGINKLALLAKLDEPTREAVTETVDVENATVRELREQISRIESENADLGQKLDAAKESLAGKDKQFKAALDSKDAEIETVRSDWKRRSDNLMNRIRELNVRIKELEERPVEHDVVDNSEELETLRLERDAANAALADAQKQLTDRPMVQEALPVVDSREAFRAYLSAAADSMKRLYGYVEVHRSDTNMPFFLEKVSGIVNLANSELNRLKGE